MPLIKIETNLDKSEIPAGLIQSFSRMITEVLNKNEAKVSVTLQSGMEMCRGGTTDPTMTVNIWSMEVFTEEKNPAYAVKIRAFLHQHFPSVPDDRIVLFLHPISRYYAQ